jgi:hypothetical protein
LQPVAADNLSDTLNLISGAGSTIAKDITTDTLTFSVNSNLDINGSVFSDGSTMLVDGSGGRIVGDVYTSVLRTEETKIALGENAGLTTQGVYAVAVGAGAGQNGQGANSVAIGQNAGATGQQLQSVAIGLYAGETSQGQGTVAIGQFAGRTSQGIFAVAIGGGAGQTSQPDRTIILNGSGSTVNGVALQTDSFYVAPIRNATGANGVVQYDATTKEVSYSSSLGSVSGTFTGNIFTSLIDSSDSSAITVTPSTIFSSNVNVENELIVSNGITFSDGSVLTSYSPVTVVAATTTAQTINDGASASYIQFVETVDTAGAYSPGVFTAPYTGYYQINLSIYFSTTVTLTSGSFFLIDSNPDVVIFSGDWTGSYLHYSTVIPATAGATIGFVFRQVSGAAIDISSGSRLTIHRVSIGA